MIDGEEEEDPAWEYRILAEQARCCDGTRSAHGPREAPAVMGDMTWGAPLTP